jgi:hypothetical protein
MALINSRNEQHTFQRPVLFAAVGQELPAGTYDFTIEKYEYLTGGGRLVNTICRIDPPNMGPSWSLGASVQIEYNELQQKLIADRQPPAQA